MSESKSLNKASALKNNLFILKRIWRYTPNYLIWSLVSGVIWGVNSCVAILYTSRLFNAIGDAKPLESTLNIIVIYVMYTLAYGLFNSFYNAVYKPIFKNQFEIKMEKELFSKALELDLAKYDDPTFYNDFIWSMKQSSQKASSLMEDTCWLLHRVIASASLFAVLIDIDVLITAMIFSLAIVRTFVTLRRNKLSVKMRESFAEVERKDGYINRVFSLPDFAKEVRVTHVADILIDKNEDNMNEKFNILKTKYKQVRGYDSITYLISSVCEYGAIAITLYKVMVTGDIGLGGFAVALNGVWRVSWLVGDLVSRVMRYHEHGAHIEKVRTFLECEPTIKDGNIDAMPFESLELRNLSFSYNGKDGEKDALTNVNLKINKGEKIAIVGYNGAGKTTLTKLIMRLYDPTDGEILYNGNSLKEYSISSLRDRMAAVFQDYKIFACTVAENVIGGEYTDECKDRVMSAIENGNFTEKLSSLSKGINTPLTREFDKDGTQLSGGEQQKIAIARACYKNADLLILDEPSASLDPDAEYRLNMAISDFSSDKTVIFISHRLSTTRHADRIYMFDNGRIVESGTHEELIRSNGKYAYMFNLQAEKYRKNEL